MSKRVKFTIAILIAISSFTVLVVLANEAATTIYMPEVYNDYDTNPTPTPTPAVAITGFHPSDVPQDDYVTLMNTSSSTLDLTGWWLKAENQEGRYDFPSGFMLGAGATVNVRSGVGTDSATDLFIGLPFSLWTVENNCVYVRDADGNLQDQQCVSDEPTPTETPTSSVYISGFNSSSIPEDDYVTIFNSATESFNLTGWWMKAESESGRYDFPTDFILTAGASVNVRTGVGTDTTTDLYIGGSYSLWTKANNCAYLRYSDGTLLDVQCID
jgi:hypothetical protein